MIVIATNNGINFLPKMLNSLNNINLCNQKVVVVDTGSSDKTYLDVVKKMKLKFSFNIVETPYCGYDSGAYIYAYKKFLDEQYIFLQDSIIIKNTDFIYNGLQKINDNTVVPIITFPSNIFDSEEQKDWLKQKFGTYHYKLGFFGPMFFVKRSTLDKIQNINNYIPHNKMLQQAMERGWPIAFESININIEQLETKSFNATYLHNDCYDYITKFFPVRK